MQMKNRDTKHNFEATILPAPWLAVVHTRYYTMISDMIFDEHVGIGTDDDWLATTFKGEKDDNLMDRNEYMTQLKEEICEAFDDCKFDIKKMG